VYNRQTQQSFVKFISKSYMFRSYGPQSGNKIGDLKNLYMFKPYALLPDDGL